MRRILRNRFVTAGLFAVISGYVVLCLWPVPQNTVLELLWRSRPDLYGWIANGYRLMAFSTPLWFFLVFLSSGYRISVRLPHKIRPSKLPVLEPVVSRDELYVALAEKHHERKLEPCEDPEWVVIPDRGLRTGLMFLGATGTGKTTGGMYPVAQQILGYAAGNADLKPSGLVLEVKGDFCSDIQNILSDCGRARDYVEISAGGEWRYNPLHNDVESSALAYAMASLINQIYGKESGSPFWQMQYANLLTNIILLYRTMYDYVTLWDLYQAACNPLHLQAEVEKATKMFEAKQILITKRAFVELPDEVARNLPWKTDPDAPEMLVIDHSDDTERFLRDHEVQYIISDVAHENAIDHKKRAQLEAIKDWYLNSWMNEKMLKPEVRGGIVASIEPLLSIFNQNPDVRHTFCPPKEAYSEKNADGKRYGKVLPSIAELMHKGRVIGLNFSVASNPALARIIGVLLKQDFQRAMDLRIVEIKKAQWRPWRAVMFLCDEYHEFATTGKTDSAGDEKFFARSRAAGVIPVVATQGISSLKSTLGDEASWGALLQQFRTKVFLSTSDAFTAKFASELCGSEDQMVASYTLSESGNNARISAMTGQTVAKNTSVSASKTYSQQQRRRFQERDFTELKNMQAIALVYDGITPHPPMRLYLKPYYVDSSLTYFEQVEKGLL